MHTSSVIIMSGVDDALSRVRISPRVSGREYRLSLKTHAVAVIGGGIVGLATARALVGKGCASLVLLEAESELATHQTGHNSGVIHSGLYYKPGSLKARNCTLGRDKLYQFCRDNGIPHEKCGKLVVATDEREVERLAELHGRGEANGLTGLRRVRAEDLADYEPHVKGVEGLWVPQTGIVDFGRVASKLAEQLTKHGGEIRKSARVRSVVHDTDAFVLRHSGGELRTQALINCAGLQSDRVARMCGLTPPLRIIPFRGEYYELKPGKQGLVRNLIYPVPDPRFQFLGVHFTRTIHGSIEAGPNAVLAFKREGYSRVSLSLRDTAEILGYGGFWRMASRHWFTGMGEMRRPFSKGAFVAGLRKLVPELIEEDVVRTGAGVRAQAVGPDGGLADDFRILEGERMLHVLNAPSPAATSCLSIGETLADRAVSLLGPRLVSR